MNIHEEKNKLTIINVAMTLKKQDPKVAVPCKVCNNNYYLPHWMDPRHFAYICDSCDAGEGKKYK